MASHFRWRQLSWLQWPVTHIYTYACVLSFFSGFVFCLFCFLQNELLKVQDWVALPDLSPQHPSEHWASLVGRDSGYLLCPGGQSQRLGCCKPHISFSVRPIITFTIKRLFLFPSPNMVVAHSPINIFLSLQFCSMIFLMRLDPNCLFSLFTGLSFPLAHS